MAYSKQLIDVLGLIQYLSDATQCRNARIEAKYLEERGIVAQGNSEHTTGGNSASALANVIGLEARELPHQRQGRFHHTELPFLLRRNHRSRIGSHMGMLRLVRLQTTQAHSRPAPQSPPSPSHFRALIIQYPTSRANLRQFRQTHANSKNSNHPQIPGNSANT